MTTERPAHGVLDALWHEHRALRQQIPEVYQGLDDVSGAVIADGALPAKDKELIALAIGVVLGCDGSIATNAKRAVQAGATREEAAEAISVAILMHGSPATVYGARAYAAFCEFDAATSR